MAFVKGTHVAFWHNGACTIFEGTITGDAWESCVGENDKVILVTYTNDKGKQRNIYLTADEMTELPTMERTQKLADQFYAIFR